MAMSATLIIVNNTGSTLTITTSSTVNDDASWSAPAVGTVIQPCESVTITMANKSVFFAPKGVGADIQFTCQANSETGGIYFDDPAVCSHSFSFTNENIFSYTQANASDNNFYSIVVGLVANNGSSASWMQGNLSFLGEKSLKQICIPGSHDAGMSTFGTSTAFAHTCNTQTQTTNILGQLNHGIRYFDIRPVISGGQFFSGHYTHVGAISSWQGANGQSIQSIIDDVNNFLANHNELVILFLSHDLNTDLGNDSYAPFTQAEWNQLVTLMQGETGLKNLYVINAPDQVDLTSIKLNNFIGNNNSAVVVVIQTGLKDFTLGNNLNQGFYLASSFNVVNSYSDTNDLQTMAKDQISKMKSNVPENYFLLSWTLTQSNEEVVTCSLGGGTYSILDLANIANAQIFEALIPNCIGSSIPNILYTDNISTSLMTSLSMLINTNG